MVSDKRKNITKFSQLYSRFIQLWTFIEAFRLTVKDCLSLNSTQSYLYDFQKEGFLESAKDKVIYNALADMINDKAKFNEALDTGVREILKKTKIPIDVACLVFMHSVLEATLYDLLEFTVELDKDKWLEYIIKQKSDTRITPIDVVEKTKEELVEGLLAKSLNRFQRKSIMKKCKRLFEICESTNKDKLLSDYLYDEKKLKNIDDLRHDIVHGLKINVPVSDAEEKLRYLKTTASYFILMIAKEFKLHINLDEVRMSFLQ
jgi:hypothetical protein